MPIVNVKLLEGRSDEQLKDLVAEVTQAVEKTTGANKQAIQVVIEEMKSTHYGVAGVRKSDEA
ncbi:MULTISPECIES: 2-hydroxymuconate tautomerase [Staphylococcus]|uniref:Tautomerase n=1 Tax=Staphylococcus hsinchuensis TaxID=3051183 RepID=A0ABZ3ECH4_9STAP|nr:MULTISPECIES: 2-hydroxymuconate tautomerase [unclassified Staphylococcus]